MKKTIIALVILILACFLAQPVFAGNLKIALSDLPDYKTNTDFRLYYTYFETEKKQATVNLFIRKEGQDWHQIADSDKTAVSDYFQLQGSDFYDGGGKYNFYAAAVTSDQTLDSNIVSTTIDTTAPDTPSEYSKEKINNNTYRLKWKTPNNDDFSRTLVYRSKEQNFTADSGTLVAEVGGAKDTEVIWEDTGLEINREYYYALRAVNQAGNASGLVGDGGTVTYEETIVEITPTPGGVGAEEVAAIPVEKAKEKIKEVGATEEGQILGSEAKEESTPAEEAEEAEEETGEIVGETKEKENRRILVFGLSGLIILGIIGYFFYRRRS